MQDKIELAQMTDNEKWIVESLRALKPFETIQITADKTGKINHFLIVRSSKVLLTDSNPIYVI